MTDDQVSVIVHTLVNERKEILYRLEVQDPRFTQSLTLKKKMATLKQQTKRVKKKSLDRTGLRLMFDGEGECVKTFVNLNKKNTVAAIKPLKKENQEPQ